MQIKSVFKKFECSGGAGKLAFEVSPSAKDAGELSRLQLMDTAMVLGIEPYMEQLPFDEEINKQMEENPNINLYELPGTQVVPITADGVVLDGVENLDVVALIVGGILGEQDFALNDYCDNYGITRDEFFKAWNIVSDFLTHKAHENAPVEE